MWLYSSEKYDLKSLNQMGLHWITQTEVIFVSSIKKKEIFKVTVAW